ncbi:M20/M25/M40 family metallo-hydrolase [Dactylosporangium roseum]|uniref:M20/M25/M40 family metallo-hydrolase n=1 Tax=Dactylosporangium roseum TaxID=47989 RepID=A0ABY5ZBH7_9ACTN|nr:M20/M25/M40 family metallo-hydrolase [Dactylosporangium roseum]UWZ39212.1 M20/M25/M40 family metallo-hydrolase [Dactylosporangium roseum]
MTTPAREQDRQNQQPDAFPDQGAERAWFVRTLSDWIAIPSISGSDEHRAAVEESAAWFAERLRETGFPTVEVVRSGAGSPAVLAEWPGPPGALRVLVYGHHDVQPTGDPAEWRTEPFRAEEAGDRVLGRGAVDDKGQMLFHLLAARAHVASRAERAPGIHLMLLAEGEEEIGSPTLGSLLAEHAELLRPDLIVISDTGIWSPDHPTVCLGMRGLLRATVTVRGGSADVHAGSFGGTVHNPAVELTRVLAALHDDEGRVAIPGFYDAVVEPTARERERYAGLPFDEARWLGPAARAGVFGEAGYSTLERAWIRPTAEVNAIRAGDLNGSARTIIPQAAEAHVSFRLVGDQSPAVVADQFRDFLTTAFRPGVGWELDVDLPGVPPCGVPDGHWALEELVAAMTEEFGREPGYTRDGGSGPGATLQSVLGCPVIFVGMGQSSDGAHGPNEGVTVGLMLTAARVTVGLWDRLAQVRPEPMRRRE